MKVKKKILSLLLAIAMILGMLPMTAMPVYAADATQIKVWDGSEMQTYTLGADVLPTGLFWNSADNRLELDGYNGSRIEEATSGDELTFYVVNDSIIEGGEETALKYSNPTIDGVAGKTLTLTGTDSSVMNIEGSCTIKNITVKVDQAGTVMPNGYTTATNGNINVRENGRLEVELNKETENSFPAQGVFGNLSLYDNGSANITVTANNTKTTDAYGVSSLYLYGTGDCDIQVTNNGSGNTWAVQYEPNINSSYDVTGAWNSPSVSYTATNFSVIVQNDGGGTGSASPANAGAGTEITLTAYSNPGKQFKEWQVISGSVTITDNKFTMPNEDVTVKAIFEDKIYTVSFIVVESTGCEASASPAEAAAGTEITLTATPASGYKFKAWEQTSGNLITITDNKFTMPVGGVTIKAIFEEVPVTGVSLDQGTLSLVAGGATETLVATVEPADANQDVSWSSNDESVATVNNGVVTPLSVGTATITVTTVKGSKTASCTVTVTAAPVTVTGISLNKTDLFLAVGNSETLSATVAPADATNKAVTWTSSNTGVATVDENGKVTAVAAGTATITAKTVDGGFEATCTVTVAAVTYAVTLETDGNGTASASPATAEAGAEITLTASPSSGYVFKKWQVVSGSVTISGNKFTMPAENVTVKAIFEEASIPITITSVTVSPSSTSVEKGGTQTFTAIVSGTGAYDNTVTWSVYGGVAGTTIDYSGILTVDIAETAETLTVNAESNGDSGKKGTATVTITDTAVIKYTLTVNNGSGSGEYAVGDTVNIYAGNRSGYTFTGWTSSDVTITNASNKNASFTMPAKNVTIKANWSYNSGSGGGGGGSSSSTNATLSDTKAEFDKNEGDDLKVTLRSGSYALRSIKNGSYTLREGRDYTISGRIVTIKASYLDSLKEGKHSLTFDMNGGTDPVLTIIVTETTKTDPQEEKPAIEETVKFEDIKSGDWFYEAVNYVYNAGLMKGNSDTTFAPYADTARGMIVTILHRLEGTPKANTANSFTDVGSDKYYTDAVAWASNNRIVSGYGDGIFGPEDSITREQLAVILMNYAKYKGYDVSMRTDLSKFADGESVSPWAKEAMSWANAVELIRGSQNQLMPTGNAQRSQVAAILQRFLETIAK